MTALVSRAVFHLGYTGRLGAVVVIEMEGEQEILSAAWLEEIRRMSSIIDKICEVLLVLTGKRETLEEKMIFRHLHTIASRLGLIMSVAHAALADRKEFSTPDVLGGFRDLGLKMQEVLDDFLKAARYDPNFLEQYYEHAFYARLVDEYRFLEQIDSLGARFVAG